MCSFVRLVALALVLLAGPSAAAWTLQGQVIAIVSGDTIRVRDDKHVQHTVRLAGLHAPEKFQAFAQRSEDLLRELVFQRYVMVEVPHKGGSPKIGRVTFQGRDINLAQLQLGGAWYAKSRAPDLSEEERQSYAAAEADARVRRTGLWRDKKPIPPWEYRQGRRK